MTAEAIRIDKFLVYARVAKTRSIAQRMVESGAIRIDRRRPANTACLVRIGQVITTMAKGRVVALKVERIPERRGTASEAETCYSRVASQDAIDANGSLA